jgi:hypothetical protein
MARNGRWDQRNTRATRDGPIIAGDGLHQLADNLWLYHERFRFLGALQIYNNGLLIRVDPADGGAAEPFLVAVNPVALSSALADGIVAVEQSTGARLRYYLGTDWHHMSAEAWARRWPAAHFVVPSERPLVFHKDCFTEGANALVLSRDSPTLSDAAHELTLIPWLGFAHPPRGAVGGEKRRGEVEVYHKSTRTLFLFDPIIPLRRWAGPVGKWIARAAAGTDYLFKRNFGPMTGFRVLDRALAEHSLCSLAALDVDRLVCGHGKPEHGALIDDPAVARRVLQREFVANRKV